MTLAAVKSPPARYEPSDEERAIIAASDARQRKRPKAPGLKINSSKDNIVALEIDHPDYSTAFLLLQAAIGVGDNDFTHSIVRQLGAATMTKAPGAIDALNFALSTLKAMQPRDEMEAMLIAQMVAVHQHVMDYSGRIGNATHGIQRDEAERAFVRLTRTYAAQMQTLKLYRSTGKQRITVKHVTVNEGGQAIVGDVNTGGGSAKKDPSTP